MKRIKIKKKRDNEYQIELSPKISFISYILL